LAECNGLPDMTTLRIFTGIRVSRIKAGKDLEKLAAILHCDVETVQRNATFDNNNARAIVRGQILRPGADLTAGSRSVCPVCLAEDTHPHQRVWWDWTFVSSCPFHNCMLAKRCSCGGALTWKDGSPVKCYVCEDGDVRKIALEPAPPAITALDHWAVDRFLMPGRAPQHFLDAMPLGHAVDAMSRIGALDLGGYNSKWVQITDFAQSPESVRARGFKCVVTNRLGDVLDRAYDRYIAVSGDPSPNLQRMYGWFYPWFQYNGGPRLSAGLGEIIFENASKKIQVTRRAFSSIIRARGSMTLTAAANLAHVRVGTMRKLLAYEGLIRDEKRKGVPISVERKTAERIAEDIRHSLTLDGLGEKLGVSSTGLRKLVRSGLVPVWIGGGVQGQHGYIFREREVSAWMDGVVGSAKTVRRMPPDAVSLAEAPGRFAIAITVLVRAILAGDLQVIAVRGKIRNFAGALLNADAVLAYKAKIGRNAAMDPIRNYIGSN